MSTRIDRAKAFGLAGAVILVGALSNCGRKVEVPVADRYPAPWRTELNLDLNIALNKAGVSGCGQYQFRPSATDPGEYLVHCTRDGTNWTAYFVWLPSGKVSGPYTPSIAP